MSKFKVGDTVMVRDWDDMVREYGVTISGGINVTYPFFDSMRGLCGKIAEVEKADDFFSYVKLSIDSERWFSDETLVLVEAAKETPASEEKTDEEPKACPLCGGKVEAYTGKHRVERKSIFVENIVRCKDCGLMLKRQTEIRCKNGGAEVIHDRYAEVIADWNRRAGNENPM